MMKKILITGISGFLGSNLAMAFEGKFRVCGLSRAGSSSGAYDTARVDLTDKDSAVKHVKGEAPDVILHCAAIANVDHCERFPEEARKANVEASANIADAALETGAKVVYISTDQVFDGTKGDYREEDETLPVNVYGKTKLDGEKAVAERSDGNIIARTNFFGWSLRKELTFAEWILDAALTGKSVTLFRDFVFNPLFVKDLAAVMMDMLDKGLSGTFHLGSKGCMTKLGFGKRLLDVFGLEFDATAIKEGVISDVKLAAKRPADVSLNTDKIRRGLGREAPGIEEGLLGMKALLEEGYPLVKEDFRKLSKMTVKGETR